MILSVSISILKLLLLCHHLNLTLIFFVYMKILCRWSPSHPMLRNMLSLIQSAELRYFFRSFPSLFDINLESVKVLILFQLMDQFRVFWSFLIFSLHDNDDLGLRKLCIAQTLVDDGHFGADEWGESFIYYVRTGEYIEGRLEFIRIHQKS